MRRLCPSAVLQLAGQRGLCPSTEAHGPFLCSSSSIESVKAPPTLHGGPRPLSFCSSCIECEGHGPSFCFSCIECLTSSWRRPPPRRASWPRTHSCPAPSSTPNPQPVKFRLDQRRPWPSDVLSNLKQSFTPCSWVGSGDQASHDTVCQVSRTFKYSVTSRSASSLLHPVFSMSAPQRDFRK